MNKKTQIILAGISGLTAVALGAFGAHALKNNIEPAALDIFKTGVLYHLIHSVVLLAIAFSDNKYFVKPFYFFIAGIILFSSSLYLYSITQILFFAMITPFGGISLLAGWFLIIYYGIKKS